MVANKGMKKKNATSLVIRELQIKNIMSYHYARVKVDTLKRLTTASVAKDVGVWNSCMLRLGLWNEEATLERNTA